MRHTRIECINGRNHLLVHVELAEDLGRIQEVLVVIDSESKLAISPQDERERKNALLRIESQHRQVQNDSSPVTIDNEQERQETVDSSFGDDVGIETVAEVNGVDVVTAEQTTLLDYVQFVMVLPPILALFWLEN